MPQIREEQIRLFATYLNTMGAGCFVAGFVAPLIGMVTAQKPPVFPIAAIAITFVLLSVCFHLAAQAAIGRLKS